MKRDVFKTELSYVVDEDIRESLAILIDKIPDYFFNIAASSTGKYHPSYALGDGGLVRHTKVAVRMATELFGIYKFPERTKDLIILSLIMHDSVKKGEVESKYTLFDHPILAGELIKKYKDELRLTKDDIEFVCNAIASHMGRFNTSDYSDVILPLPKTPEEKFVHMCDYLASRKSINLFFDKDNNIVEELPKEIVDVLDN
jgi:23S rRNA maturation-related 3'-5' exoribonuclease YhaM